MLLYGGTTSDIEPVHRLLNADLDQKRFGLLIIRVCLRDQSSVIVIGCTRGPVV